MNFKCADRPRRVAGGLAGIGMLAMAAAQPAWAQAPRRVVSINLCTDQLVLALAEREQIAGLGRFSRHAEMSFLAARAAGFPTLRGSAEEVMRLKPDLVLAGAFSGRATRAMLSAHGVRVETFAPPRSLPEATAEIERMAGLLRQPARGSALVAEITAAIGEAHGFASGRRRLSALAIQRRGFASGRETLLSAAMEAAGITNAAGALGIGSIARAPLEAIVKLAPDVLILEDLGIARDQSTAVLHHPVLRRAYGGERIIKLPVAEVTCGGPALATLIRRLAQQRASLP